MTQIMPGIQTQTSWTGQIVGNSILAVHLMYVINQKTRNPLEAILSTIKLAALDFSMTSVVLSGINFLPISQQAKTLHKIALVGSKLLSQLYLVNNKTAHKYSDLNTSRASIFNSFLDLTSLLADLALSTSSEYVKVKSVVDIANISIDLLNIPFRFAGDNELLTEMFDNLTDKELFPLNQLFALSTIGVATCHLLDVTHLFCKILNSSNK